MSNVALIREIQSEFVKGDRPVVKTGMEVEVHQRIMEGTKERTQRFKGLVIKTSGKTALEKTFTVRKVSGGFGIEKIFPVNSANIEKIDVLRQFKVRRKNIGFIKTLTGKAARLKEVRK